MSPAHHLAVLYLPFSSTWREDFTETPTLLLWQVGRGREVGEYRWHDVELGSLLCSDFADKRWEGRQPLGAGCSYIRFASVSASSPEAALSIQQQLIVP